MIRRAVAEDLDLVIALIRELAEYENALDQVQLDRDRLRRQMFDENAAEALLAFDDATGEPVGLALYFFNFSTWYGGRGLYLEDLFVRPAHRGRGHGKAFFRELARIAAARDCGRMEWSVLDWNESAKGFYAAIGATPVSGWTVHRLSGEALQHFASTTPQ